LLRLSEFLTEPASWYQRLKPDAFVVYETTAWEEHWWLEVDRATESLPTLRRKLLSYIDFTQTGNPGPRSVVPRVLVSVPNARRATDIEQLRDALPLPARQLITVEQFEQLFTARPPP
jgi:hypothetical protein